MGSPRCCLLAPAATPPCPRAGTRLRCSNTQQSVPQSFPVTEPLCARPQPHRLASDLPGGLRKYLTGYIPHSLRCHQLGREPYVPACPPAVRRPSRLAQRQPCHSGAMLGQGSWCLEPWELSTATRALSLCPQHAQGFLLIFHGTSQQVHG